MTTEEIACWNARVFEDRARARGIHLCVLYTLAIGGLIGYLAARLGGW